MIKFILNARMITGVGASTCNAQEMEGPLLPTGIE